MPTNAELISRFGSFMRSERGLSENTIDSYVRDVRKLAEWFTKPLPEIQCTDITRHLASRRDAGSDGRSNYRFLASFRCFFGFLIDDEEIAHDPTIGVPRPRYTKPLPDVARHQDIETMIASLGDSWLDIRDRAMLYLFFGSGLRESELAALRLSDIDLNQALVKIWGGKGGKDAVLPISGAAVEALRRYLTDVRPKIAEFGFGARLSANPSHVTRWRWAQQAKNPKPRPASPFLFLGQRRGHRMTRQQVFYRIRDIAKAALGKSLSPHALRHGFATTLVENGADILDVQALMRHARVSTTQRYLHLDLNYLKEKYDACHPRARTESQDRGLFDALQGAEPQSTFRPRLPSRPRIPSGLLRRNASVPDQPQNDSQLHRAAV